MVRSTIEDGECSVYLSRFVLGFGCRELQLIAWRKVCRWENDGDAVGNNSSLWCT